MEPSTEPAARRVEGGEAKERVSMLSVWTWREARIVPGWLDPPVPDAEVEDDEGLDLAPAPFCDLVADVLDVEGRGRPMILIMPPAPPTAA